MKYFSSDRGPLVQVNSSPSFAKGVKCLKAKHLNEQYLLVVRILDLPANGVKQAFSAAAWRSKTPTCLDYAVNLKSRV
jgi:hypothetical protein